MKLLQRLQRLNNPRYDVLLLIIVIAGMFCFSLGDRPYSAPSESRYIEIGREMAQTGDFVTPRLDYVKYFEKPPLFYWVQAVSTKLFGVGTFVSRLPTVLFTIALCLVTYALGRLLYGRRAGVLSALILATSIYVFALSRIVLVDVPVSLFMDATLLAFLYCIHVSDSRLRPWVAYAMYIAAACAVLSKGLIGIVLPGAIIFLWFVLTKQWWLLRRFHLLGGIALFLLIALPWHILVAIRNPEFLHFYFIHEHVERYLTKIHGRYQPKWYFIPILIGGLFPWIPFVVQAVKTNMTGFWQHRKTHGTQLFLALWISVIFAFFSLSDSKLPAYILPIFPPIAVMIGHYFSKLWHGSKMPGYKLGLTATFLMLAAMAAVPSVLMQVLAADSKVIIALKQGGDDVTTLAVSGLVSAIVLLIVIIQGKARHVIVALLGIAGLMLQLGDQVAANYNSNSVKPFVDVIHQLAKPGSEVVTYDNYYQDLPVYLGQRITIVHWKGELEFGAENEDDSGWMIEDKEFWQRWMKGDHRMFVLMRLEALDAITHTIGMPEGDKKYGIMKQFIEDHHLFGVLRDERNVLFVNQNFRQDKQTDKDAGKTKP